MLALAKGLLAQGVRFGDRVAIMSRTRYEWTLFDFALWTIGAQFVPIYPTSSAEQVFWMLHDAEVSAAMVEHEDHAMTIGSVIDRLPQLKRLWQLDAERRAGAVRRRARTSTTRWCTGTGGRSPPTRSATIIYTSGHHRPPQGLCASPTPTSCSRRDTMIEPLGAGLPLQAGRRGGHRCCSCRSRTSSGGWCEVAAIRGRVKLGHQPQLNAAALLPDLAAFQPTFILAVPYIFEKVFNAARRKAETEGKLGPVRQGRRGRGAYAEARGGARRSASAPARRPALRMQHQLFDKLVYGKVRDAMGGRVAARDVGRLGDGPAARPVLRRAPASRIYEGYGLTESTRGRDRQPARAHPVRHRRAARSPARPCTSRTTARSGCTAANIFQGYLNDPKATDAALHDGWLATGDLGSLDEDGYLTITGRKKEILVTSGGKSVSPAVLEERVRAHPLVAQCIVVGNDRPYIAALVTLDQEAVDALADDARASRS